MNGFRGEVYSSILLVLGTLEFIFMPNAIKIVFILTFAFTSYAHADYVEKGIIPTCKNLLDRIQGKSGSWNVWRLDQNLSQLTGQHIKVRLIEGTPRRYSNGAFLSRYAAIETNPVSFIDRLDQSELVGHEMPGSEISGVVLSANKDNIVLFTFKNSIIHNDEEINSLKNFGIMVFSPRGILGDYGWLTHHPYNNGGAESYKYLIYRVENRPYPGLSKMLGSFQLFG